jgi:hypothetical protein
VVLDTFVRALPHAYRNVDAPEGTLVTLSITGESGNRWFLLREDNLWRLYLACEQEPHTEVVVDEDVAWRIFTKGLGRREAQSKLTIIGDRPLGLNILETVSIIA